MTPREQDAAIAIALGWERTQDNGWVVPGCGYTPFLPHWFEDDRDAVMLLNEARKRGWGVELHDGTDDTDLSINWRCDIESVSHCAPTIAGAVAGAFLKAIQEQP